jgi:hypothetical protein
MFGLINSHNPVSHLPPTLVHCSCDHYLTTEAPLKIETERHRDFCCIFAVKTGSILRLRFAPPRASTESMAEEAAVEVQLFADLQAQLLQENFEEALQTCETSKLCTAMLHACFCITATCADM